MAGFTLPIGADTRDAVKAIDDLTTGLTANADALDAIAKAGPEAGAAVTKSMEEAQAATQQFTGSAQRAVQAGDGLTPMALEDANAFKQMAESATMAGTATERVGEGAGVAGRKVEEGSEVGKAALQNLGFQAMTAGELFDGPSGLINSVGSFAAFFGSALGPELALPVTVLGFALAALGQTMATTEQTADKASPAVKDFIGSMQDGTKAADSFDEALRAWAKDATDFGGQALADVADAADKADVSLSDYAESIIQKSIPAMAAQEKQLDALKEKYVDAENAAATAAHDANDPTAQKYAAQAKAVDTLNKSLGTQINNVKQAEAAERVLADQMGLTLGQYRDYGKVLQAASDDHVKLTKAQKDQIAVDIAGGTSTKELTKDIKDNSDAVKSNKEIQDDWNKAVTSDFSDAASASDDWAKSNKVNLDQVTTNLNEAADLAERLPGDIDKAVGAGLTQEGLKLVESLPNGQQILDQIGVDPGSPGAQKLIAAANRAGQDTGKSYKDGVEKTGPAKIPVTADAKAYDAVIARIRNNPPPPVYVDIIANYRTGNRAF